MTDLSFLESVGHVGAEEAFAILQKWFALRGELTPLRDREMYWRKFLSRFYFRNPPEGTQKLDLGGGYDLVFQNTFTYKVDEVELENITAKEFKALKIPVDELIEYKPALNMKAYRALSAEQQKLVDRFIECKQDAPKLDVVLRTAKEPEVEAVSTATTEKAAPKRRGRKPKGEQPDNTFDAVIATNSTDAEVGNYFTNGIAWWVFVDTGAALQWQPVSDVALMQKLATAYQGQQTAPKKRAARKTATAKRGARK